mmetsp:Transcript_36675/g.98283  ORF Transcript_36675/g.98283 Transcript_36675/m.98283 type:complete len:248 (-) Transcript_36675:2302-3045(-)
MRTYLRVEEFILSIIVSRFRFFDDPPPLATGFSSDRAGESSPLSLPASSSSVSLSVSSASNLASKFMAITSFSSEPNVESTIVSRITSESRLSFVDGRLTTIAGLPGLSALSALALVGSGDMDREPGRLLSSPLLAALFALFVPVGVGPDTTPKAPAAEALCCKSARVLLPLFWPGGLGGVRSSRADPPLPPPLARSISFSSSSSLTRSLNSTSCWTAFSATPAPPRLPFLSATRPALAAVAFDSSD